MTTHGHTSLLATEADLRSSRTPALRAVAASAIASEAAAAALLWTGLDPGPGRMLAAASAHAIAAVFFAAFLRRRAQRLEIEAVGRGAWLMFALASAVLPLVGPLALSALIARLARTDDSADAMLAHAALTPDLDAPVAASTAATDIGAASFEARLRFDPDAASRRAAVLATRRLRNPADGTRILRLALRDHSEEVRLLAHALLEDRERRAYDAVDQLTRELAAAPADRRAPIACLLAEASLELCTAGLVSGELESFTLRRARALMEDARASAPIRASASAALLFGRVLLRQGEARDARTAFEESRRLGAPDSLTAPFFAEITYRTREAATSLEPPA